MKKRDFLSYTGMSGLPEEARMKLEAITEKDERVAIKEVCFTVETPVRQRKGELGHLYG